MYAWYLPRSLGETTSPMIAMASAISPPAPSPWSALKPISSPMFRDSPERAEPTRKMTIAAWNTPLRPYRSLILPYSGVELVEASR